MKNRGTFSELVSGCCCWRPGMGYSPSPKHHKSQLGPGLPRLIHNRHFPVNDTRHYHSPYIYPCEWRVVLNVPIANFDPANLGLVGYSSHPRLNFNPILLLSLHPITIFVSFFPTAGVYKPDFQRSLIWGVSLIPIWGCGPRTQFPGRANILRGLK